MKLSPPRIIENAPPKQWVVILQVNYFGKTVFYFLTQKEWEGIDTWSKKQGFICVWKLRKVKPFGPKPPRPLSFLVDPDKGKHVEHILEQCGFGPADYEIKPSSRTYCRIILKQYGIRQTANLFHKLGTYRVSLDIL